MTGKRQTVSLIAIALEPECWREQPNTIGGKPSILKPDLYAVTAINDGKDEYEDYWFMEVDLATESPATVIRKCEQYVHYWQSGQEQRTNGLFPRVVWLVPTDKRKESITRHIADNFTEDVEALFIVITLDQLNGLIRNEVLTDHDNAHSEIAKNAEKPSKNRGEKLGENACNQGESELFSESKKTINGGE
jgi:hypothetical protein